MATCHGCGKQIVYQQENGRWVPINHPEGGRHTCEEYKAQRKDAVATVQAQKAPDKAATGPGKEAPPAGGQSPGQSAQPPPATQERGQGPIDRELLIVLQSSLKVSASLYGMSNHPAEDFDMVVEKVLEKAIEITSRLFQEAGA